MLWLVFGGDEHIVPALDVVRVFRLLEANEMACACKYVMLGFAPGTPHKPGARFRTRVSRNACGTSGLANEVRHVSDTHGASNRGKPEA